jgi:hypothetical protein
LTRLESWATPGVPDVLCCAENGAFSFLELKVLHGSSRKVGLSPHQVAWQTRHGHGNTFVVVRAADLALRVYLGSDGVDLRMDGVDAVEALEIFVEPYDWARFWELTCPGSGI